MARPTITQKPCSSGCNDGNPMPKENFSDKQWQQKNSKCIDCIKNRLGPPSARQQKRKASNDAALAAEQQFKKVKEQLAEAMTSGADEATISALRKQKEIAKETSEDATKNSYNGKRNARRKKSNDAAKAAKKLADEAKEQLAEAMTSGADVATISALRKQKEIAKETSEDATKNSYNGKRNARNKKSNDAAKAAKKLADEATEQLAEAMTSGADEATISALRKEKEAAGASAEDLRKKSRNGRRADRRNIKTFPSGFVLDKRTMYDGLDDLIASQKANPTQPSRRALEIGRIIAKELKNGGSVEMML